MNLFSPRQKGNLVIIFVLGFCTIPAQVILMREFLLVFGGNELIIGLFLAIWMLLTAGGSFSGKLLIMPYPQIPYWSVFLSWLPVLMLYLIDLMRNRIFLPGIEPGVFQIVLTSSLLLMPFCFLSGLMFANMAGRLIQAEGNVAGDKAYAFESMGSMAGGLLFSLALVFLYDNFRAAEIIALTGSILVLTFCQEKHSRFIMIILSLLVLVVMIITFGTGSRFARSFLFRNQEVLETRDTPYGNLTMTGTSGQFNLFENNVLLFSTDNQQASEETVHFAMLQHQKPQSVLLISGGIAGLTNEILKYKSVKVLDYLEIDPVILELGKKYTSCLNDSRINLIEGDPRIFLRKTTRKYDIIILHLPEPSSFQINRYYTAEFMSSVKTCLNNHGIFTFSLPLTGSYLNEGYIKMYSSLVNTCRCQFRRVSLFPGLCSYFVASDLDIMTNIGKLIEYKNIKTDYVNSYYIDQKEMELRSWEITRQLLPDEKINTDFKPCAVSGFYQYWLNRFQMEFSSLRLYALLAVMVIFAGIVAAAPSYSGMFAAGFTSSALQLILILSFQIVYGYIYRSIGLFAAVFMTGLAMGSMFGRKVKQSASSRVPITMQLILTGISVLVPCMINLSAAIVHLPVLVHLLYLVAIWLISFTTGIVFSLSVHTTGKSGAIGIPAIYGADLAGASLGAFITILVMIPLVGIKSASLLSGLLNLMVASTMFIRKKRSDYR
jgi:spermidine synthase